MAGARASWRQGARAAKIWRRCVVWTQLTHRALGIAMSALMLLWFASGIVMTFAGYPSFDERERLETTPVLPSLERALAPADLAARGVELPAGTEIRSVGGHPVYAFTAEGSRIALDALTGAAVARVGATRAVQLAEARFEHPARWLSRHTVADQWTLSSSFAPYFPLHRLALDDGLGTELYVSECTGEVVQLSTRNERALAWMGAIVHWVYPAMLRRHRDVWRWLVIGLSLVGLSVCLSGLGIGTVMFVKAARRRRATRRFVGDGLTPYKQPWLRWHHLFGLAFGVLASSWTFSGALSLTPFDWSPGASPPSDVVARWRGPRASAIWGHPESAREACRNPVSASASAQLARRSRPKRSACSGGPSARSIGVGSGAAGVKQLTLGRWQGEPFYLCTRSEHATQLYFSERAASQPRLELAELQPALERLVAAPLTEVRQLHEPDDYHYPSHYRPHFRTPFVRAAWADAQNTTAYVDPHSAALLRWHTPLSRAERWLYNGLHSLDFRALYAHPLLWQSVVIAAMLIGVGLSGSGLVLGGRWLRRAAARRRRRSA